MILAACYMGALAWALVPIANVRTWTGGRVDWFVSAHSVQRAQVPLGPYVIVALLLGLLATSVLLASVAVDDDYARRLADATQPAWHSQPPCPTSATPRGRRRSRRGLGRRAQMVEKNADFTTMP